MKLVSITTVDEIELNGTDFSRLIDTGRSQVDKWVIVLRSTSKAAELSAERFLTQKLPAQNFTLVTTPPCGVSHARNRGLKTYLQNSNDLGEWISFPDDDCWYTPDFRSDLEAAIDRQQPEMLVIPYGPDPELINRDRWPDIKCEPEGRLLSQVVSSAGIFAKRNVLGQGFDEQLGVGTSLESAEDVEMVFRAVRNHSRVAYDGSICMLHEYRNSPVSRSLGNFAVAIRYHDVVGMRMVARTFARTFRTWLMTSGRIGFLRGLINAIRYRPSAIPLEGLPKRHISGLKFDTTSPRHLVSKVADNIVNVDGSTRTVVAGHVTSLNSSEEHDFRAAFNEASYAMVDGYSLVLLSRLTPGPVLEKMATTDFIPEVIRQASESLGRPIRAAIVGGEADLAIRAGQSLSRDLPVDVVYTTHGFRTDRSQVVEEVNNADAELLILGLGMPVEAIRLETARPSLLVPVVITCGGWLRLLAGDEARSPALMQQLQLEWLWRLSTDPRRTWTRYSQGILSVVRAFARAHKI